MRARDGVVVPGSASSPAMVRADPRLVTLDGLNYDFHGVGEYRLLQHAPSGLEIQMRTVPATADMSSVGAIVVSTSDSVIEFGATGGVTVDGRPFALADDQMAYLGDGVLLTRRAGAVELLTAFDDQANQAVIGWSPRAGARGDFRQYPLRTSAAVGRSCHDASAARRRRPAPRRRTYRRRVFRWIWSPAPAHLGRSHRPQPARRLESSRPPWV